MSLSRLLDMSIEINLRGVPFRVHDNEALSNAIRTNGDYWESDILDYIRDRFPIHKVVLDIGANIGNHAVYFATHLIYTKILAFEPLPENYELLRQNIQPYGIDKVSARNWAISDRVGRAQIVKNEANYGACEVSYDSLVGTEVIMSSVDTLTEFWQPVTLMKIDVEWWEPHVIAGAQKTIERDHPLILIEDTNKAYGPLLPQYDMIYAWDHHKTYLYKWRD